LLAVRKQFTRIFMTRSIAFIFFPSFGLAVSGAPGARSSGSTNRVDLPVTAAMELSHSGIKVCRIVLNSRSVLSPPALQIRENQTQMQLVLLTRCNFEVRGR
jgi:hypothetical protein